MIYLIVKQWLLHANFDVSLRTNVINLLSDYCFIFNISNNLFYLVESQNIKQKLKSILMYQNIAVLGSGYAYQILSQKHDFSI